jgi:glutathione synthase/RimK-type ligase-like ATP-grasp enzyme
MPDVAFVTYREHPQLIPDDRPLLAELDRLGWGARAHCWDEPGVDWTRFAAVVLRSCWDYHLRPTEFRAWLARLDEAGVRLWNPTSVVRWNLDKHYLRQLAASGVAIPGTAWFEGREVPDLHLLLEERGWTDAVIKPTVSAAGYETWRTNVHQVRADQVRLAHLVATSGVLIQEFVPEVVTEGELSLVYLAGEYSHAVRKRPAAGDFRVQERFGGTMALDRASDRARAGAERALAAIPGEWIYARVDGVERGEEFLVMELEVIEPSLFFAEEPLAARRLVEAIIARS